MMGETLFAVRVYGIPAPQGSKNGRAIYRGSGENREFTGKVALHESSKKVKPWRTAVKAACTEVIDRSELEDPIAWGPIEGGVELFGTFYLPKPKRTKFGELPVGNPDLDKVVRSTQDAFTLARVWVDDNQVVDLTVKLRWAPTPEAAGALLEVRRVTQ